VVDTNFLILVFLKPSGYAASVLRYIKDYHTLILSDYILYETLKTIEKLTMDFKFPQRDISTWNLYLPYIADEMIVLPENYLEIFQINIRDHNDIGIVATSVLSRAHLLISNDKDIVQNEQIQQHLDVIRLEEFESYIKKLMTLDEKELLERMISNYLDVPKPDKTFD
jgi:predicted nucleic acid-binding protein